jgi:hypothetical protein
MYFALHLSGRNRIALRTELEIRSMRSRRRPTFPEEANTDKEVKYITERCNHWSIYWVIIEAG